MSLDYSSLIAQLSSAAKEEQYGLKGLARRIKDELENEKKLNCDFYELNRNMMNSVNGLEKLQNRATRMKQQKRNQIKLLYQHENAGNIPSENQLNQRKQRERLYEKKVIQTENQYKHEWNVKLQRMQQTCNDLKTENENMFKEIAEYQEKIKNVWCFSFFSYFE